MIAAVGRLRAARASGGGMRLEVEWPGEVGSFVGGESVAVNGACLTVAAAGPGWFAADASPETLRRTTLGKLRTGSPVNLERALRLSDRLGGHLVLGHVDGVSRVSAVRPAGAFTVMRLALPAALAAEVAEKGSIAIDGVSLTVSALGVDWFEVALIPATIEATTLGGRRPGDEVNLETDVIAKYVRRAAGGSRPGLSTLLGAFGDATD
ncbi:MAG: riboflavin synthase [Acidobacteriota bacterium]